MDSIQLPTRDRCPVCRAEMTTPPACRRCKADLSLLFSLESQRKHYLAAAHSAIAEGQEEEALEYIQEAKIMRTDAYARRLEAAACLLGGDFESAWRIYHSLGLDR